MFGICNNCGMACEAEIQDQGIGPYEFWGSRGVHHDWVEASPCCSASVVEGGNKVVRTSEHVARRDHKKGRIKKGDRYRVVVTHCWRKNGPHWFATEKAKV